MSVSNNINIAKVTVSLIIRAVEQGLEKDLLLARKIDISQKVVNDINTDDPTNADLPLISNQLYAMCGGYAFEAQRVLNLGGAGIVGTTTSNTGLTPYTIGLTLASGNISGTTIMSTTQSDWYGLSDFVYCFINQGQLTINVQFSYNPATGIFDFALYPYTPQVGDIFSCQAFKTV